MGILFVLIPLSLLLLALALAGFFWMVKHEQFDDLDSAGDELFKDDTPDNE